MVHNQQSFVVKYVSIVVVVQNHRCTTIIPHVLYSLGVWDFIRTLVQHVLYMARVQHRVYLWVQPVHQLHTVCSTNTMSSCRTQRVQI